MTTEHSLVTYGNGDNLREVFNAIAAAMNSDSAYSNLIHLAIGNSWSLGYVGWIWSVNAV